MVTLSNCCAEVQMLDEGVVFEVQFVKADGFTPAPITGASLLQFRFKVAGGAVVTKTAVFTTNGADGKVRYTTVTGDLAAAGPMSWQFIVTGSVAGAVRRSRLRLVHVLANVA